MYYGYFLDNVFNTDEGPVYDDNGKQTRSHFRFKLKYATFTKHQSKRITLSKRTKDEYI